MFIDENGNSSMKYLKKAVKYHKEINDNEKYFTVSGCVIRKENFLAVRDEIVNLKRSYWENGKFRYKSKVKRVCFHSTEIRQKKGPFSDKSIDYSNFIIDLSNFINNLTATLFSSTIDKEKHYHQYIHPDHPYNLCLDFILERYVKYYLAAEEEGLIILEARGKKEDMFLLEHIKNLIENGTRFVGREYFRKIKGVYFNTKWCKKSDEQLSYFGLECADLISYPIHKYSKYNTKDKAFDTLENMIFGYPRYLGKGLKIFP